MKRRHFLLGLLAGAGSSPSWAQAPAPGTAVAGGWAIPPNAEIRRLLVERIDVRRQGVGMAVGVIDPAGVRLVAHGASGAGDGRALDGDTVFQIGSVSKVFVTLLLSDMVLRGEIALDDPAEKFLPAGVRMPERGRAITLLDLATHMSGLPSMPTNLDLRGQPNPVESYTTRQWYTFLSSYRLTREPGTKVEYSNQGVALLGHLLARRAERPYEELLKARLLDPLGMDSTAITLNARQRSYLAFGHDRYGRPVESWEMRAMPASGSMRSTAKDLLALLAAYLGHRDTPLKAAMAFQVSQVRPANSGINQSLGLPILAGPPGSEAIHFHDGGKEGFRSLIALNLRAGTGIVLLANARSEDNINALGFHLLAGRALPQIKDAPPVPAERKMVTLPRRLLDSYEGRYRTASGGEIVVACLGSRLLMDVPGDGVSEFFSAGEGDFFSKTSDAGLMFQGSSQGAITGLILRQDSKEISYARIGDGQRPGP